MDSVVTVTAYRISMVGIQGGMMVTIP